MRDDFSMRTKDTLARRVGFHCSNPDCAKRTSGPAVDPSKVVSIGVASHITAASPGGPRYDETLTAATRRSIGNAIWLCADCARLIDSDPGRISSVILHEWKVSAERAARESLAQAHGQATNALATEIRVLRSELSASLDALRASRWKPARSNNAPARVYLSSMLESARRLRQDAGLFASDDPSPHVTVDFSEIYAYAASNAELVVGTPLMDYCLQQSRVRLLMPPGTVYELQSFVRRLTRRPAGDLTQVGRRSLETFIRQYERAPESPETQAAFEQAFRALTSSGTLSWQGLQRLAIALDQGLLAPDSGAMADPGIVAGSQEPRHFFLLFERYRPGKQAANWADAINLTVLSRADADTRGRARMISSAPSLLRVAADAFSTRSLVRTSREYAILLRAIAHGRTDGNSLLLLYETVRDTLSLIETEDSIHERHLPTLRAFADAYRRLFSPVDGMISDALSALPMQRAALVSEFYRELVRWNDLGRAFRDWWDRICADLNAIDHRLETTYMGSVVREEIEKCIE